MRHDGKKPGLQAVPNWHALIDRAASQQHVRIEDFSAGDVLGIAAAGRQYSLRIIDPERRRVELTSDDPRCPGPVDGCLQGSKISPWGSSIFMGRIAIGLCAVFSSALFLPALVPPEIDLPPADRISVGGIVILPADPSAEDQ